MCLRPIPIQYVNFYGKIETIGAPCGKCVECQIALQNMWKVRLIEENKNWKYCYFFTLTYRDSSLPFNCVRSTGELLSTARKSDVQSWLKRFRTRHIRKMAKLHGVYVRDIEKSINDRYAARFSYFICSEYGPNGTRRPHYHGLIFTDLLPCDMHLLFNDWRKNYGYVKWNRVKQRSNEVNSCSAPANYCAKYCCKGAFCSRSDDISSFKIEKEWRLMSKSIGLSYVDKMRTYHLPERHGMSYDSYIERIYDRMWYHDGSFRYSLPRYYRERIFYSRIQTFSEVWNKSKQCYEIKESFRYAPRTYLSYKMQDYVRNKHVLQYQELYDTVSRENPSLSDSEICLRIESLKRIASLDKQAVLLGKLNKFYLANQRKHKQL